jgi:alpha-glucoside transport system substrate-binding protein
MATPAAGTPVAASTAALQRIGGTVSVLATWGGEEQQSFMAMVAPYQERTGVQVRYEGTRDLNAVLTTRVQGNNPPDVAGLPGPGQMAQYARQNKLIDLSTVLNMTAMRNEYIQSWLDLGTVDGKLVGIFIKSALKGPIWYSAPNFQRNSYQIPTTWDQLTQLSQQIAGTGTTPWSIGLEAAAASGWPGTDWIEDILLRQAGPDAYNRWHMGQLKWTSPEVKRAWETWGAIVNDAKMTYGGRQYVLSTNFGDAANPVYTSPPRAYLHHQGSFITDFIVKANPNLKPVQDFNFFMFPDISPQYSGAAVIAGDLFGMFRDTPQSRALMQWLVTAEAQSIWVKRGGALSANKAVTTATYPDEISKRLADTLSKAKSVHFDGSDLMPEQMNNAFWRGILDYVSNPGQLDSILSRLDGIQASSYTR